MSVVTYLKQTARYFVDCSLLNSVISDVHTGIKLPTCCQHHPRTTHDSSRHKPRGKRKRARDLRKTTTPEEVAQRYTWQGSPRIVTNHHETEATHRGFRRFLWHQCSLNDGSCVCMKQLTGLLSDHNQTWTAYRITHTIVVLKFTCLPTRNVKWRLPHHAYPSLLKQLVAPTMVRAFFTACDTCCSRRFLDFQRTSTKYSVSAARSSSHERTSPHLGIPPSLLTAFPQ
ncbi:unnamed protein product [Ectocarpus sp. 12 AP-2014]